MCVFCQFYARSDVTTVFCFSSRCRVCECEALLASRVTKISRVWCYPFLLLIYLYHGWNERKKCGSLVLLHSYSIYNTKYCCSTAKLQRWRVGSKTKSPQEAALSLFFFLYFFLAAVVCTVSRHTNLCPSSKKRPFFISTSAGFLRVLDRDETVMWGTYLTLPLFGLFLAQVPFGRGCGLPGSQGSCGQDYAGEFGDIFCCCHTMSFFCFCFC